MILMRACVACAVARVRICVCTSDKYSETQMKLDKTEATIRGLQNSLVLLEERNKKLQSDCEKCRLPFSSLWW